MPGANEMDDSERILVSAPTGHDAANALFVLQEAGLRGEAFADVRALTLAVPQGVGAILLAEESIQSRDFACINEMLKDQPPWSDIPVILISSGSETTQHTLRRVDLFNPTGNVTLLERPLRPITLVSSIQVALRSRRRQYQFRDLLAELEFRVQERTARLQETISELEAFSYSVSHDLRAPLRAMEGYSQFLLEDFSEKLGESGRDYAKRIASAASRLDQLVQDILTYSRVSRGHFQPRLIDLEELIDNVIQTYPPLHASNARIQIKRPLHKVLGHESSLTQCLSNLLGNAVKFVPKNARPKVRVRTEQQDGTVRIWIEDNGIGIPEEHQSRIFNMFEKAPHPELYEGTGIGLAIVRKAVERMGGEIGVFSEVGRGTQFWIDLPGCS
jgi:signal transduction histidine kinase